MLPCARTACPLHAGLLRGLYTFSSDGCLYAETFAINLARRKTADKAWGDEARGRGGRAGQGWAGAHVTEIWGRAAGRTR